MRTCFMQRGAIRPMRLTAERYPDIARWCIEQAEYNCAWWKARAQRWAAWIVDRAEREHPERD